MVVPVEKGSWAAPASCSGSLPEFRVGATRISAHLWAEWLEILIESAGWDEEAVVFSALAGVSGLPEGPGWGLLAVAVIDGEEWSAVFDEKREVVYLGPGNVLEIRGRN